MNLEYETNLQYCSTCHRYVDPREAHFDGGYVWICSACAQDRVKGTLKSRITLLEQALVEKDIDKAALQEWCRQEILNLRAEFDKTLAETEKKMIPAAMDILRPFMKES